MCLVRPTLIICHLSLSLSLCLPFFFPLTHQRASAPNSPRVGPRCVRAYRSRPRALRCWSKSTRSSAHSPNSQRGGKSAPNWRSGVCARASSVRSSALRWPRAVRRRWMRARFRYDFIRLDFLLLFFRQKHDQKQGSGRNITSTYF